MYNYNRYNYHNDCNHDHDYNNDYNNDKLGLSWAKLSQSWDLFLSYITLLSDLDAFVLLCWPGLGFETFFGSLSILIASEA